MRICCLSFYTTVLEHVIVSTQNLLLFHSEIINSKKYCCSPSEKTKIIQMSSINSSEMVAKEDVHLHTTFYSERMLFFLK